MAYSATSRIIHKLFINVNPLVGFFREYFGFFSGCAEGGISSFYSPLNGKLLLSVIGNMQVVIGQIGHAAAAGGTGQEA